jgi:DNA gyrase inhibitor GyrI
VSDLDVRIERLNAMRVAWVQVLGRNPEEAAWARLSEWAKPAGLLDDPELHPVFGFNNPAPERGVEEYGYEFWIAIDPDTQPPEGIGVKDFPGGLYAVTTCSLRGSDVPQCWRALLRWVHASRYTWRRGEHELERIQNPLAPPDELVLDLCLPLEDL